MKRLLIAAASSLALTACGQDAAQTEAEAETEVEAAAETSAADTKDAGLDYPETRKVDQVDEYHGQTVEDPYRWLENDVREDESVAEWVAAQNAVTFAYIETLPGRNAIKNRLEDLFNYERFGLPNKEGGKYFYSRNDGLQDQSVFYVAESLDAEPQVLIDPNGWAEDGTVALAGAVPSPTGEKVAYLIQDGGSDWRTIKVKDVSTGVDDADVIEWVKFSGVSWAKDGSGFYYSRYPEPEEGAEFQSLNYNQTVYFHELGTDQAADEVVFAYPEDPEVGASVGISDDGDWMVVYLSKGTDGNGLRVKRVGSDAEPTVIFDGFANNNTVIGNDGSTFFIRTDYQAPNYRLIAVDAENPDVENAREIIPEGDFPIQGVSHVGGKLIVETLEDAKSVVRVYETDGAFVRNVDLPGVGSAGGFGGEATDEETFYVFTSYNRPTSIYRYDVASGASTIFKEPDVAFNPDDYIVEQVFYESKDGTRVPMFVSRKKGVTPNGERPTLLYGYGGFNISLTPSFSVTRLAWMEMGGVYAVANIRGGGEYGRDWHDGGRLKNKQNVFDDFIAAGEALIDEGWASKDTLAIYGGSNGGLLVGAVVNQRPDLFAAAIPAVGVMDMLRFNQFTAGRFWVDDYGDPQDPEMFEVLKAYSPYHNLTAQDYPAVMVTTADTDDRVVPGHSFKYAARLQEMHTGEEPVLIRIETRAGHGAGTPISKTIEQYADLWAFLAKHTGLELSDDAYERDAK